MKERCFRTVCRILLMAVALCGFAVLLLQSPPRVLATVGNAQQAARLPRAETGLPSSGGKLVGPSRAGVLPQPDLWVAVAGDPYIGNNSYLMEAQTVGQSVQPFTTAVYHLTVQNDDSVDDTLLVIGTAGGDGWTITYHDALTGGTNITSLVTTTGWPVGPLAAGETRAFRAEVTPPAHAAPDLPYTVQVSAISLNDLEAVDTVVAVTFQEIIDGLDLVSVNNADLPGNGNSINPAMDASGRYVAFESQATNLVALDTNNCRDVFLFDRKLRTVERISVSSTGVQGNGESFEPVVSGNGRFVAFRSHATNLVAGDTNAYADIFLRDRQAQTTTRVSVSSAGTQGRLGHSYAPTISFDGRYVAFHSYAQELVPTDLDTRADVFLRDTQAGTTQRISVAVTGTQGTGDSFGPSISADGRYIAYWSGAKNLVLNDTNNHTDIFVYDRVTGQNTRVSVADGGVQANNSSFNPSISGNGRYVAFESLATNLVSADGNNARDIFVHDRLRGLTTCVSVTSGGVQGNANSESARISHDGMMVAFYSAAYNLTSGDTNARADIFVHNRQTGVTACVSTNALGKPGNNESKGPAISANGRFVAFHSFATDLSPAGQEFTYDVYVRDTMTDEPTLPYQPDLWLRNSADARYIGNNLYTLAGQTKAQSVAIGETAVYHVLAENDGSRPDVLVITGPAGSDGWTVRYFDALDGGADITDQVTGSGWETPVLGFEEGVTLRVEVTPDATVPPMQTRAVQVTAMSQTDGTFTDAVSVATTRKTLSHVTLTMDPPSAVRVGSPITLTAEAFGGNLVQYRFYAMKDGETGWTRLRDYNLEPTYVWTPAVAGKYTLLVWAREVGRTSNWDAYTTRPYTVASAALESVTLSALPASPVPPNTMVTLLAQAQGGVAPQYRFYVQRKGETSWTMIRPYAASPTCAWEPTDIGQYTLLVWARELNSPFNWDKYATLPFVVGMEPHIIIPGTNPPDDAEMVWVPGGTFIMGTAYGNVWELGGPDTQLVTLSGYWIYKYEVKVAQYRAFCVATGRALPPLPSGYSWEGKSGWDDPALQNHPIVNVTWNDAKAYADWAGVALPTEAQWEYASRGRLGNNYPWGGTATVSNPNHGWDQTKCANYYNSYCQGISTWPVGSFPRGMSWCGAHDLAGNVWEWCADWFGPYSTIPVTNPTGPATGMYHVLRGGTWFANYGYRGALRGNDFPGGPDGKSYDGGFRCVSLAPGP